MLNLVLLLAASFGGELPHTRWSQPTELPVAIVLEEGFSMAQLEATLEVLQIASRLGGYYRTLGADDWLDPILLGSSRSVRSASGEAVEVAGTIDGADCMEAVIVHLGPERFWGELGPTDDWIARCKPTVRAAAPPWGGRRSFWRVALGDEDGELPKESALYIQMCTARPPEVARSVAIDVVGMLLGRQVAEETAYRLKYEWVAPNEIFRFGSQWNPRLDEAGRAFQRAYIHVRVRAWAPAVEEFERLTKLYPQEAEMWYYLGLSRHNLKKWRAAIPAHQKAAELPGYIPYRALYNLACSYALLGETDAALAALRQSAEAGFSDHEHAARDSDLASVRDDPRFVDSLTLMRRAAASRTEE